MRFGRRTTSGNVWRRAAKNAAIEIIKTTGDKILDVPAQRKSRAKASSRKEIEEALLDGRIDLAVHSLKDLPTELPKGLTLAAMPQRADPRDAIIGGKLRDLKFGAMVGTSSLRRIAQLKRYAPISRYATSAATSIRASIKWSAASTTRSCWRRPDCSRLGWGDIISEIFRPDIMCPAVGQGALAIETLEEGAGYEACAPLDDPWTRLPVTAERAMLAELGGGCQVPIGAFATLENTELFLTGAVFAPDGSSMVRYTATGECTQPAELGRNVAQVLLKRGAQRFSSNGSVGTSSTSPV